MLSDTTQAALNGQINAELSSAYLYLSMSAACESRTLEGFAAWMRRQAREEVSHAMRIFDYVIDQNGRVALTPIGGPPADFGSVAALWQQVLDHEREVSERIRKLYELAVKQNDYATQTMLQWFLTEQVEEEKTASRIVERVKQIGDSGTALFFLDRHVGKEAAQE